MYKTLVTQIEEALKLHINYTGYSSGGRYLQIMGRLAWNYSGAPAPKVSALLEDYFKFVGAANLTGAISRLKEIEKSSI